MTIYSGQVQVTRYKILGTGAGKQLSNAALNDAGSQYKAPSLVALLKDAQQQDGIHSAPEIASGWVPPENVTAVREWLNSHQELAAGASKDIAQPDSWDLSLGILPDGVMLRMRIDQRRVPAQLVKELYKQKLAEEEATGKGRRKRLTRDERDALKQHVHNQLTSRALPTFKFVDAFWRDSAAELQVFTTAEPALKNFEELFTKSFATKLEVSINRMSLPMQAAPVGFWVDGKKTNEDVDTWLSEIAAIVPASIGVAGLTPSVPA